MHEREFEGSLALTQLKCSGTTSVLELMEYGYPSRVPFAELYNMYKSFLPPELVKLEPKIFCEAMLHSLRLNNKDFKFGITKVFFRPGKFVEFDRIMKSDPENLKAIVAKVKKWLVRSRWIKSAFAAICVIRIKNRIKYRNKCVLLVQKIVRGYLVRKQHQPRYRGITNIKAVKQNLTKSAQIAGELKGSKDIILKQAAAVEQLINNSIQTIRANERIQQKAIDKLYADIIAKIDGHNNLLQSELKKQRQAEEQERLRHIQEAIEAERRHKEAEEQKIREEEEIRRKLVCLPFVILQSLQSIPLLSSFVRFFPLQKSRAGNEKKVGRNRAKASRGGRFTRRRCITSSTGERNCRR